jgi:Do/DeqQ family serine protease
MRPTPSRSSKRIRGNLPAFLLFLLALAIAVGGVALWRLMRPKPLQPHLQNHSGWASFRESKDRVPLESDRTLETIDREFTNLVEHVIPSVVSITTTTPPDRDALIRQFFGLGGSSVSQNNKMGSGMIVSPEGYIVTNWHVINGASQVTVQLSDGRSLAASIAGADQRSDIAVLKIAAEGLQPISFGDSELVKVGQMVFAVGNPFGLQETVTQGIISAKGRRTMSEAANEFFQTSTTINPGNSGGPLVDIYGKVIGINNFILSRSGGSEGIGFSIPSNVARRVYEDIVQRGRVIHPWFGIVMRPLTVGLAKQLGLPDVSGALVVATLAGSPAERSGLAGGDVITSLNHHPIRDGKDLRNRVAEAEVGPPISLEVLRGGKPIQLSVTMTEEPTR